MSKKNLIIGLIAVVVLIGVGVGAYVYFSQNREEVYISGKGEHPEAVFSVLTEKDLSAEKFTTYTAAIENLKTMPGDKGSLINLGYIFKDVERYGDAERAFTILATWDEVEPDPEGQLGLARTYEAQEKYREAELSYYAIVKTFPLYITAYKGLLALYDQGKREPDMVFVNSINHAREFDKSGSYAQELQDLMAQFSEIKNRQ